MVKYREILRLFKQGISQRNIAASCQCSRNTVSRVLQRAKDLQLSWEQCEDKTALEIAQLLFPKASRDASRKYPDLAYVHKELQRQGVSLKLLWQEYGEACRSSQQTPLMYSQFCHHYQQYAWKHRATLHIPRKPGEQIEVDWAGKTGCLMNRETGAQIPVYFFVGVLSYSQYAYVEAFLSRSLENWILAHVHMFQYFGGVARMIVPDNLKTGVAHLDGGVPAIQQSYQEMAEHYATAIIPARVRRPRDKANVEGMVSIVSTWIIAAMRQMQWFHLKEMNTFIQDQVETLNAKPFQKKPGSRTTRFLEEEQAQLLPLPEHPFELAAWKEATVQLNYHVELKGNFYSVPYEYIHHRVHLRFTAHLVEIYYHELRIASHPRLEGPEGQYSTLEAHMPKEHQQYLSWDSARFLSWASKIGPKTQEVIQGILQAHRIEPQGYRSCLALLKLSEKGSPKQLETACDQALQLSPRPSFKSVKMLFSASGAIPTKANPSDGATSPSSTSSTSTYGFTRGAAYYGRKK